MAHIVQGHVDGVAEITKIEQDGESTRFTFKIEPNLVKFYSAKGLSRIGWGHP
ncbi:MAG: hypothetical protein ACJ0A7_06435 [Alphaproteobacteria bacterium]